MDLGVLEGQTRGDYFLNSIFDPSVKQCTAHCTILQKGRIVSPELKKNTKLPRGLGNTCRSTVDQAKTTASLKSVLKVCSFASLCLVDILFG